VAVRAIEKDQFIADADLSSVDHKEISGHYAMRAFMVGEKITPKDVSNSRRPATASTMAAVISMSSPVTAGAGATAQLRLDQKPFGKPGKALASVCDNKSCDHPDRRMAEGSGRRGGLDSNVRGCRGRAM
jgi:hypothetical protein